MGRKGVLSGDRNLCKGQEFSFRIVALPLGSGPHERKHAAKEGVRLNQIMSLHGRLIQVVVEKEEEEEERFLHFF